MLLVLYGGDLVLHGRFACWLWVDLLLHLSILVALREFW
jgi:hypothetical protein